MPRRKPSEVVADMIKLALLVRGNWQVWSENSNDNPQWLALGEELDDLINPVEAGDGRGETPDHCPRP